MSSLVLTALTSLSPSQISLMAVTERSKLLRRSSPSSSLEDTSTHKPTGLDPLDLTASNRAGILAGIWIATFLASVNSEPLVFVCRGTIFWLITPCYLQATLVATCLFLSCPFGLSTSHASILFQCSLPSRPSLIARTKQRGSAQRTFSLTRR
jgi:hypothetical protein